MLIVYMYLEIKTLNTKQTDAGRETLPFTSTEALGDVRVPSIRIFWIQNFHYLRDLRGNVEKHSKRKSVTVRKLQ